MLSYPTRVALLLTVLLSAGCAGPLNPLDRLRYERRPGTLAFYHDPVRIEVPERAIAGVPFTVVVTTYGGGCMKQGDTEQQVTGLIAEVRPYDYDAVRLPRNLACPDMLAFYRHEAQLTFARAGTARVRVHGWSKPQQVPLTVERTLIVEPTQP